MRASQRRLRDLTGQLVRLVDVHAGAEARIQEKEACERALRANVHQLEAEVKVGSENHGGSFVGEDLESCFPLADMFHAAV